MTNKRGNRKSQGVTPSELEQSARLTQQDLASCFSPDSAALSILREIDEAAKRTIERNTHLDQIIPVRQIGASIRRESARGTSAARGECPPLTNRGGKSTDAAQTLPTVKLVLEDGVVKQVPQRRGYGGSAAIVDWVNFTFGEEAINPTDDAMVTDEQVMIAMSNRLNGIFGFGITSRRESGVNFYHESWVIGDGYGFVGHGGQRGTILVMLNGTGCAAAAPGWEIRLKSFLEVSERARITRCDMAHDDYTGSTYSVDQADQDHTDGLFNCGGRNPDCEYRGNWKNPNGKGRTFQVGNRKNGKFCRVYEKGRELGDKNSEWVRIEVEFKSVDRVIPFDVLTDPGAYLAKAYPAFEWIQSHQERILTTQKVVQSNVSKAVEWLKHQAGSYIHNLIAIYGVDGFIARCSRDDKTPNCFKVPHFSFAGQSIHERKREYHPLDLSAAASAW